MLVHFPRITTDGLVLCLDAGNPLSYSGLGPELVTNSDLLVADDGNYDTINNSNSPVCYTGAVSTAGKTYQVSWKVLARRGTTSATLRMNFTGISNSINFNTTPGILNTSTVTIPNSSILNIVADNTGVDFDLDYVSIKELPTTINDLTGNSNNYTLGAVGQCPKFSTNNKGIFVFDGGDSIITAKTMSQMNVSDTSFSICCYINRSSIYSQSLQGILGFTGPTLSIKTNASTVFLDVHSSSDTRYIKAFISGSINDRWLYLTVTVNNNIIKTYCNGILNTTTTLNNNIKSIQDIALTFGTGYNYYQYKGDIGQVLMYDTVLSDDQILQNYLATKGRYGL
jgi:hypothetical protein